MTKKRQSLAEFKRQQDDTEPKEKRSERDMAKAQSNLYGSLFVVGILIVGALALFFYLNRDNDVEPLPEITIPDNIDLNSIPDNSQSFESLGGDHVPSDAPREYNSNPPTSGPHNQRWITPLGVYRQQQPDDMLVHNLEHGHIWLSYRDANDAEAIALFKALQQRYADRIVVSHRPENPSRIAAAAWTRLLPLDELDAEQIEAFIIRYNDQAPESIMGR